VLVCDAVSVVDSVVGRVLASDVVCIVDAEVDPTLGSVLVLDADVELDEALEVDVLAPEVDARDLEDADIEWTVLEDAVLDLEAWLE
jgi:hypothetical protein